MVPDMVQPQARMRPNQFRNQATVVQREGGGGYSSTPCNGLLAEATCIPIESLTPWPQQQ